MIRGLLSLFAAVCLLAGCGGEEGGAGDGAARLWITRDRGADVVLEREVSAGISALEALRREADVETRHGGRFVRSIDGVEGDAGAQQDWFFFINGYEADLSAADYRLHDGDVVWWDYRSWGERMREPVVVGAFPEPFLHGWDGERRPVVVEGAPEALKRRLVDLLTPARAEGDPNRIVVVEGAGLRARMDGSPGDPVVFEVGQGFVERLLDDPSVARFRYSIP